MALVIYRNNLMDLVIQEKTAEFFTEAPEFEYAGYDTAKRVLRFKIGNPYSKDLNFSSISAEVFCSDHDFLLGCANETEPINIPKKSSVTIEIALNFTAEGTTHIATHHLGKDFYVDLQNLAVDIQGIRIKVAELGRLGPISWPKSVP